MRANEKEKNTNATTRGTLLSNFETSHPEMGNPIMEVMGIAKRIVPSSASFKLKKVFIVGILEAQVEKQIPERKKYILKAIRCFDRVSIAHQFVNAKVIHHCLKSSNIF